MHRMIISESEGKFVASHSAVLDTGDLVDVQVTQSTGTNKTWVDQSGTEYRQHQIESLVPIPGRASIANQPAPVDLKSVERIPPHRTLEDGRIVSQSGKPWTFRGTALRVLNKISKSTTHIVDGHGNSGPRGREWWIREKQTGFIKIPYLKNGNEMPVNLHSQYTINLMIDTLEQSQLETLMFDIKRLKKEWNFKYHSRLRNIGFQNECDYDAFLRYVLRDVAYR